MDRFSILYLHKRQYKHISYPTRAEANTALESFSIHYEGTPIGVYDAKTELFYWEITRFDNKMSIEEQGRRGNEVITIIQTLRSQEESKLKDEELKEGDVLMRPLPLFIPKIAAPIFETKKGKIVKSPEKEKRQASARRQKFVFK
jgi:hypothetical protein